MITRTSLKRGGNLALLDAPVPQASLDLEAERFAVIRGALSEAEQDELRAELNEIFETTPPACLGTRAFPTRYS